MTFTASSAWSSETVKSSRWAGPASGATKTPHNGEFGGADLPSGATFLLRRPGLQTVIEWDALPTELLRRGEGKIDPASISDEELAGIAKLMRDCLVYCCVEPRISDRASAPLPDGRSSDESTLSPAEISMADALFILRWAMRGPEAAALAPFRAQPPDAGAGGGGENVRTAPLGTGGDTGARLGPGV